MKISNIESLEKRIDVNFKNKAFLEESITHRSYINENPKWQFSHNERLEFLGDAVLELAVTEKLFKKYPKHQEGELTSIRAALVNHIMLARISKDIGLEKFVHLSKGEAKDTGRARDVLLANAVESVIGAIYLDKGYETARLFVEKYVMCHLGEVMEKELFLDSKSQLQEIVQEDLKLTPTYKILAEEGPDHNKEFIAGVFFGEKLIAKGRSFSKQEAEREAASAGLKVIKMKPLTGKTSRKVPRPL